MQHKCSYFANNVNEIVFKIFLNHYDEKTNDSIAGRGAFRKAFHSITALNKYGFNPILVIKTNECKDDIKSGFIELGKKFKFETEDINRLNNVVNNIKVSK